MTLEEKLTWHDERPTRPCRAPTEAELLREALARRVEQSAELLRIPKATLRAPRVPEVAL